LASPRRLQIHEPEGGTITPISFPWNGDPVWTGCSAAGSGPNRRGTDLAGRSSHRYCGSHAGLAPLRVCRRAGALQRHRCGLRGKRLGQAGSRNAIAVGSELDPSSGRNTEQRDRFGSDDSGHGKPAETHAFHPPLCFIPGRTGLLTRARHAPCAPRSGAAKPRK
jgi:hypothetical protein